MHKRALCISLFGAVLLGSYVVFRPAWAGLDRSVFFFFNSRLAPGSLFLEVVAYTNKRLFDVAAFLAMGGLYWYHFLRKDNAGRRIMICLGVTMLLAGILIKQAGVLIPISHPSPTLVFEGINRLTQLTDIVTKDAARDSFPGDHGMMLMIFAAFMGRYFGRRTFAIAALMAVIFAMPRIASGAHWFSDIYVGSLSIACMALSWYLLTPASDTVAAKLERFLPTWFFPSNRKGMFG